MGCKLLSSCSAFRAGNTEIQDELQYVARLVLSQPASASICERINSEFVFVKDPRRNKLSHAKANKLVALFHNLRLLARVKKPRYSEPAVGWNQDDFAAGVTAFGVSHYESTQKLTVKAPARPCMGCITIHCVHSCVHSGP